MFFVSGVTIMGTFLAVAPVPSVHLPQCAQALGETRERLEQAYHRLASPPLSDIEFVLADVSFRQHRRFNEYSGDVSGRMLGAVGASAAALGIENTFGASLMKSFTRLQKPDGHFGADQDLAAGVQEKRDTPILWGNSRLLLALAERARRGDAHALKMAQAVGDYVISTRPYYGRKENFEVGGALAAGFTTCYPAMIDGLTALGEVSSDRKYQDEARFIAELSLLDKIFEKHHSHGRLTAYRGMLDLDRITGRTEFLDAVRAGCRTITNEYEYPTGGIPEVFERSYPRDEGCSNADWIRVNLLLWQATGETAYLDAAEHTLLNHVLATTFSNGGYGHRPLRTLHDGDRTCRGGGIEGRGSDSYWCCSMHVTQILAELASWSVLSDDSGLIVTWLAEARSTFKVGDREITAEVRRERPGRWKVALTAKRPGGVQVRLRVPEWASAILVDGRPATVRDGWAEVRRTVNGADSFLVDLRERLRVAGVAEAESKPGEPVRLFMGPRLLCLPDVQVGDGLSAPTDVPIIAVPPVTSGQRKLEALLAIKEGEWQRVRLLPTSDRPSGGCRVVFRVRQMAEDEFKRLAETSRRAPTPPTLAELCFAAGGNYEVYLNGAKLAEGAGFDESARIETYLPQGPKVVLIRARESGKTSGVIGFFSTSNRLHITSVEGWSAVQAPAHFDAAVAGALATRPAGQSALKDAGTWGSAPWGHMPAQFAGTAARWIWPSDAGEDAGKWWVFRYVIP